MARSIGNSFLAQLTGSKLRPFFAIKMNFRSGALLLNTTYADIVIDGNNYLSSAGILEISSISEGSEVQAIGINITLNGLDTAILSAGLIEDTQGMVCDVYFGVLTTSNNADTIVDTPYQIFSGFIDSMAISETGELSSLTFSVENKMIILERPVDRRYTDQDQENLFPGDKGLEFVTSLQDKSVAWGAGVVRPQAE